MRTLLPIPVVLLLACGTSDPAAPAGDDGAELARAAVASVSISPGTAALQIGATTAFSVVVLDTRSRTVTNPRVTWLSADPSVATVNSRGLLKALAAGTTSVIAEAGGFRDTASVLVEAGTVSSPSGGTGSCAAPRPEWLWCDDFETDRLASYFEYVSANGSFSRVAGVGRDGSQGMRARFAVGQVSAGNLKLAFGRTPSDYFRPVDAGVRNYRDIYWRLYLRTQEGWTGGGGYKLTRATVFAGSNWSQAAIAHLWTSGTRLTIDPASGTSAEGQLLTTTYNDFANLRWLGSVTGTTPLFDASQVGRWYCIETRMRLNDAGQANGIEEFWIDGRLEARRADLNFLGTYSDYGINTVMFENYWNGGSPADQERYFDDIVVSTAPIGC